MTSVASRRQATKATDPSSPPRSPDGADDDVAEILLAVARGSEDAWRQLVARYGRRIYAMARSRCGRHDLAEDITQSVFVTLAEKLGSGEYTEQGRFEQWLFRIAMNRVRDEQRRLGRRGRLSPDENDPPPEALAAPVEQPEGADPRLLRQLRDALEQLPEADRQIIELRHHANLPFKVIAEMLDEPLGTLLARHHRAIGKVRKILDGEVDS